MKFSHAMIALLVVFAAACSPPSQHDEARFGTITVALGPAIDGSGLVWRADQQQQLVDEFAALAALGPSFIVASEGTAQIVVRPFDSGPGCTHGVGRFTPGTHFVEVDPACARGFLELRAAVGHEVGHSLNLRHICIHVGDALDCDGAAGYGVAMMNPDVSYGDVLDQSGAFTGVAQDVPTDLDLAEYILRQP